MSCYAVVQNLLSVVSSVCSFKVLWSVTNSRLQNVRAIK